MACLLLNMLWAAALCLGLLVAEHAVGGGAACCCLLLRAAATFTLGGNVVCACTRTLVCNSTWTPLSYDCTCLTLSLLLPNPSRATTKGPDVSFSLLHSVCNCTRRLLKYNLCPCFSISTTKQCFISFGRTKKCQSLLYDIIFSVLLYMENLTPERKRNCGEFLFFYFYYYSSSYCYF